MSDDMRSYEEIRLQKLEERQKDMVHKADLRALIEQWRLESKGKKGMGSAQPYGVTLRQCADELEALVEGDDE